MKTRITLMMLCTLWMVENLKTTKYRDETAIPNVTEDGAWAALTTPAYCWYDNDSGNKEIYGAGTWATSSPRYTGTTISRGTVTVFVV